MTAKRLQLKAGDKALIAVLAVALVAFAVWSAWHALADTRLPDTGTQMDAYVVVTQTSDGFYRADPLSSDIEYTVETPGTDSGEDAESGAESSSAVGSGEDVEGGTAPDAAADPGENLVRIRGGAVEVVSANCANQVCVEHDPISEPGEQIVCLPHGLVIEVVEDEKDATALS